jgi:SPP1 gp7 family putative phage head morphogenesis protein
MREAYNFGKNSAADELKVPAGTTKRDSTTFINQNAQAVTDKQIAELTFIVKTEVLKDLRKNNLSEINLGLSDVIASISMAFAQYFTAKVSLTGPVAVMQSFNRGRMDTFTTNQTMIYALQWSSIMDERTCDTCAALDGSVYAVGDNTWEPPVHIGCRCIEVMILTDELNPPDMTGFPKNPGGMLEPDL